MTNYSREELDIPNPQYSLRLQWASSQKPARAFTCDILPSEGATSVLPAPRLPGFQPALLLRWAAGNSDVLFNLVILLRSLKRFCDALEWKMLHKMKFIISRLIAPGPKIKPNYNHRDLKGKIGSHTHLQRCQVGRGWAQAPGVPPRPQAASLRSQPPRKR